MATLTKADQHKILAAAMANYFRGDYDDSKIAEMSLRDIIDGVSKVANGTLSVDKLVLFLSVE